MSIESLATSHQASLKVCDRGPLFHLSHPVFGHFIVGIDSYMQRQHAASTEIWPLYLLDYLLTLTADEGGRV